MTVPAGALIRNRRRRQAGYGRVLAPRDGGFALVIWPGEDPKEMRVDGSGDLVRARLHPGQRVRVVEGDGASGEGVVVSRAEPETEHAVWTYTVGMDEAEERVVAETALDPMAPGEAAPLEVLTSLGWRGSRSFASRLDMSRTVSLWYENAFGIPAFLGARIVPLPHQIHAARRVLTDRTPRFVLADEVGLGKTIEAGMILQALAAAESDLRVLVIAPGAMSRQWLCELFLRFGEQVCVHLDALRLEDLEWEELLDSPRVIVSTSALEASPDLVRELGQREWSVLVVDEAHQIHPDGALYGALRGLARDAKGVLALSATPAKGDVRGLLGLLGLVAPDAYDPSEPERFERALEAREAVAGELDHCLRGLEAGETTPSWEQERAAALAALLPDDGQVQAFSARVAAGEAGAFTELVSYVQEYHRIDRRLIRTRRATVQALGTSLCERELEVLSYQAPESEVALVEHMEQAPAPAKPSPLQQVLLGIYRRRACSDPLPLLALLERRRAALKGKAQAAGKLDPLSALGADPGPREEEYLLERVLREAPALPDEAPWLTEAVALTHAWMEDSMGGCARLKATLKWLRKASGKVLVFAQEREMVEACAEALKETLGPDVVGAIHHGLEEQQLSEIALRFQQPGGACRILVSDELGGEGRNFQAATAVIHLDQPWTVGRLEQRIGRLDRIGRSANRPVRSVVLCGPSPSERALLRLHDEVLGVYRRSLGGLEFLLPEVQRQVTRAACAGAGALDDLVKPLTQRVDEERGRDGEAYERALDASTRRLEEATEQAEVLDSVDGDDDALSISAWAKRSGIKFKSLGDGLWSAQWNWEHLLRLPPGLVPGDLAPDEGRVRKRGTFSRQRALGDESLELFGPGHPLIDALLRDLRESSDGRCAAFKRNLGPDYVGHAYLLVVAQTHLPADELPAGLRYRAQGYLWPQVRTAAVRLLPGKSPGAKLAADRKLLVALEGSDSSDRTIDADELARGVNLPVLWSAAKEGVEIALESIREDRRDEVEDAARQLSEDLADDVAYLRGVIAREEGEGRATAESELAARDALVEAVRSEQVELEALALVIGVTG